MDHPTAASVGAVVAHLAHEAGVSQRRLAEATGIPRVTLRRRIAGTAHFDIGELRAVARSLGTTASAIVAAAERAEPEDAS